MTNIPCYLLLLLASCQAKLVVDDDEYDDHPLMTAESEVLSDWQNDLIQQGMNDTTTVVEYSLKVYYTAEVKANVDTSTFIDQMIDIINEGYSNSNIPVRVVLHCSELAIGFEDIGGDVLARFDVFKSSVEELRQSADAAMLLIENYNYGGRAWIGSWRNQHSISVVRRNCVNMPCLAAGHELGHNFGLEHSGWIFGPNNANQYKTMMGPGAVINYYSGPNVLYKGMPTGAGDGAGADNAKILRQNRFVFAAQGNELKKCRQDLQEKCHDLQDECPVWAAFGGVHCDGYAEKGWTDYMKKNCKKSCNIC